MKKLLLILLFTLSMSAQKYKQTVIAYNHKTTYGANTSPEEIESNLVKSFTIVYYYFEDKPIIKIHNEDKSISLFDVASEYFTGTSKSGETYGAIEVTDTCTKEKLLLQVYDNTELGMRLIDEKSNYLQLLP